MDFEKICSRTPWEDRDPSGVPVIYYRCPACRLIFTGYFDSWGHNDFAAHVYNDGYLAVDGDYVESRPRDIAKVVSQHFSARNLRVLDFGGGNGATARFLKAQGFGDVTVYEPFNGAFSARPAGLFDLVLCVEVLEHSTQPVTLLADISSFLKPDGLLFITTLLQDSTVGIAKGEHWYIAPRNGHVLFHSDRSLKLCARSAGLTLARGKGNIHFAFRAIPEWGKHLFKPNPRP